MAIKQESILKPNEKGFTLLELIVVMGIIAILVLLAAPRFVGYTKDAKVTAMVQDTKVLGDAAEQYHIQHDTWPVLIKEKPIPFGVGGVSYLMPVDPDKLDKSVQTLNGTYGDYGLAVEGKRAGEVFHVAGVRDKSKKQVHGKDQSDKQGITFKGVTYDDMKDIPRDEAALYRFQLTSDGYIVEGFDTTYIDTKLGGVAPTEIAIPSTYKGKPVIKIADSKHPASTFKGIKEVIFPENLTAIGYYAFYNNSLESIVIPDSVVSIQGGAFQSNALTALTIPNSVTVIGRATFTSNKIADLSLPNTVTNIDGWAFNDNQLPPSQAFIYERFPNGTLDKSTIISYGGKKRDHLVIPTGVKTITKKAFRDNGLKSVVFPEGLKTIEYASFYGNQRLSQKSVLGPSTIITCLLIRLFCTNAFQMGQKMKQPWFLTAGKSGIMF